MFAHLAVVAAIATALAGRPIEVHCSNAAPPSLRSVPWIGWAYVGEPAITLRPRECRLVWRGDRGALHTVGHEVAHTRGIANENKADAWAYAHRHQARALWRRAVAAEANA